MKLNIIRNRQFTPVNIDSLKDNEVFVFGSNLNGNHAGGAARLAVEKFGAIDGQNGGLQGQSYAIPTLGLDMEKLDLKSISTYIDKLYTFADENADLVFLVTKIGCGIAGFSEDEIKQVFYSKDFTPFNVVLPQEFTLIKGVKGFAKDMRCRGFQFKEGEEFTQDGDIKTCSTGFHYCENPLQVNNFYKLKDSEMCEVEGFGRLDSHKDDSKIAVSNLRVKARITIPSMLELGIEFTRKQVSFLQKRAERLIAKGTENSGRDSSVNSGRDSSVNSGHNYSVNSGRDSSVNSGRDSSVNSGRDYSVNSGRDYSVNSGHNYSVNSGRDYSVNSGRNSSVNSGRIYSVNSGLDYSVNSGRDSSVNSGLDYSVNSGRDSSVNSGLDYSVNSGLDYSVNSGRNYSVNSGLDSSVNSGRNYSVNSGLDSSVNSGLDYSVNSGRDSSVNSGRNYSVNSGLDYSVNSGLDSSVCAGRFYSAINLDGANSFGIAGKQSKIRGKKGCAICLVEYNEANDIISVASAIVDGKIVKESVYYTVKDGVFIEAE